MNHIENCQFYGVKWDEKAIESIRIVAQGLLNLTELFKSQNINIETLLKIDSDRKPGNPITTEKLKGERTRK